MLDVSLTSQQIDRTGYHMESRGLLLLAELYEKPRRHRVSTELSPVINRAQKKVTYT